MKLTHTSPTEIKKINSQGTFNDCLFFSDNEYVMTASNSYFVYELNIDEEKIINEKELYDDVIINQIADIIGCYYIEAESILDGSKSAILDFNANAEQDWMVQAKQGECAKKMGYEACKSEDEQGTVYIVPMLNRESDLKLVKKVN